MEPEIETVAPSESGDLIVYQDGQRLTPRPVGRPPTIRMPEPSARDRAFKLLRSQGIGTAEGDQCLDKIWKHYQEHRKLCAAEQLPNYFLWDCQGCRDSDGQRDIPNGRHRPDCNGVNAAVEILWPGDVVYAVAQAKGVADIVNLQPSQAAQHKLTFWSTEAGKAARKKELAAAVKWLHEHDRGDPEQWVTRLHLLHFVGLAGLVGVPKVFDAEIEADLEAALAAK